MSVDDSDNSSAFDNMATTPPLRKESRAGQAKRFHLLLRARPSTLHPINLISCVLMIAWRTKHSTDELTPLGYKHKQAIELVGGDRSERDEIV